MGGVIAGGLLVLAVVVVTVYAVVLPLQRQQSDASTRAQVVALKGAALGMGQTVQEVTSVYADDQPAPMRRVAPARRVLELGATDAAERDAYAVEAPHPGVVMPGQSAPAAEPRPFGGW